MPRAAATAIVEEEAEQTLGEIAREEWRAANGDKAAAVAAVSARIADDDNLRDRLAVEAIELAARAIVASAQIHGRASIVNAIRAGREGVKSLATGMMRGALDMPMLDGTPLRDATADLITQMIEHYRRQVSAMSSQIRFLQAVLKQVPDQGTVGDVLTDEAANALFRRFAK